MAEKKRYKFKRPKSETFTILNGAKKEIGRVRVEPMEIAWRPFGSTEWHRIPIEKFARLALEHGHTGEAPL